ncbi:MAG: ankyrin repeat domain-containing protein [Treponemataceae bacterium]|nr:ankyrin repeat domain-containing protein [Treponemataceae bacterium]
MKKFVKKNWCVVFVALALCAAFAFVGCFGKSDAGGTRKNGKDKNAAPMEALQNTDLAEEPQLAETEDNSTLPVDEDSNEDNSAMTWTDDEHTADSAKMLESESAQDVRKTSEFMEAVSYHETATVQSLIESGINVNAKDHHGNTALIYAVWDIDMLKILIQAGANVNAKNRDSSTALMSAAAENATDTVSFLINAGADVNAKDEYHKTALMWAAEKNATDAEKLLIDAGADVNAKDYNGKTALMFAEERNAKENDSDGMIQLLKAAGAFASEERRRILHRRQRTRRHRVLLLRKRLCSPGLGRRASRHLSLLGMLS